MEQIYTVIITGVCGVLTAVFSLIIAYLVKKQKQLEEKNRFKYQKIDALHNGFRQDVFTALVKQDKKINELKTDVQILKETIIKNDKDSK